MGHTLLGILGVILLASPFVIYFVFQKKKVN